MIKCGIDIIEIDRIIKSCEKPEFINKIFTDNEFIMFKKRKFNYFTIAANFCAKEALMKSLGNDFTKDIKFKDIEVLRDNNGRPFFVLFNKIKDLNEKYFIDLSISHSKTYAVANVVLLSKRMLPNHS